MTSYVYSLSEPGHPDQVRYIGKSNNPAVRLRQHLSKRASSEVRKWIDSLTYEPHLEILAKFENETEALIREREEVVAHIGAGHNLPNGQAPCLVELSARTEDAQSKNLGATKLGDVANKYGSIRGLAKSLGCDNAVFWRWINGDQLPSYRSRKKLETSLGISMDSWDRPCSSPGSTP
jgi:hypothetical protein